MTVKIPMDECKFYKPHMIRALFNAELININVDRI